jgi:hypothetical protein
MKQRNLVAIIIFSIITFGIYDLYWLSSTQAVNIYNFEKDSSGNWSLDTTTQVN